MYTELFTLLLEESGKKETGRVTWVDDVDAFGVISTKKGIDVSFYCESIGFETCKNLQEGDEVEFEVSSERLSREALNIRKISKGGSEV